jgi:hypothetical protein
MNPIPKSVYIIGFIVGLIIVCTCSLGNAEGGAGLYTIQNENLVVEDSYGMKSAFVYAEIVNTGDANIELDDSVIELLGEDGSTVTNITSIRMYPDVLESGKTGYLYAYKDLESDEDPTGLKFNIRAMNSKHYKVEARKTENPRIVKDTAGYGMESVYMEATLSNDQDYTLYNFSVCFILKDKETGKIVEIDERSYMDSIGILPGSSVSVRQEKYLNKDIDIEKYDLEVIAFTVSFAGFDD